MQEEQDEAKPEEQAKPQRKGHKKLIIIIAAAVLALGAGGFFGYTFFIGKGKVGSKAQAEARNTKAALVALDPFVVNLAEQGRYLKVTMQFEIEDASNQSAVTEKMPNLRDAVITLLSSKSPESISGPEGKFQLKDELLLRANQAVGKDVFKNLFFTDFVMQ